LRKEKNHTRFILLLVLALTCGLSSTNKLLAQDPVFSQYYNAPLQLNPAFAGTSIAPIFSINYRNEWPLWPRAYTTYAASYDQFFPTLNSGFGMNIMTDNAGDGIFKTTSISGIYSYKIYIQKDLQIKFGIEATTTQSRLDWDRLIFFDQLDPSEGTGRGGPPPVSGEIRPASLSKTYFDFSVGMLLYNANYYGGITLKHINTPDNSFLNENDNVYAGLPMRVSLQFGSQINIITDNKRGVTAFLSPNILLTKQSDLVQLNLGTLIGYNTVQMGVWYRHTFNNPDAVIGSIGVRKDLFRISYSYDYTISDLAIQNTGGSHEIGVLINLERLYPQKNNYNDCFAIFR